MGRAAKPVLLLMLHLLRRRVHSLAGVRKTHWDVLRLLKVRCSCSAESGAG